MRAIYPWATAAVLVGGSAIAARGQEAPSGSVDPVAVVVEVNPAAGGNRVELIADEMIVYGRPSGAAQKSTYLGVATSAAQPSLQKQLQLKPGVGLVVDSVDPGSPADQAGVKEFDILHKLDNQLLINTEQYSVLVKSYKPGTEVQLTLIREGKPQTLSVKLGEQETKPLSLRFSGKSAAGGAAFGATRLRQQLNSAAETLNGGRIVVRSPDLKRSINAARVMIEDDRNKMTVNSVGGKKHLKVQDRAGKVVFEGPIDTPENLDKVPADLRKTYEEIFAEHDPEPRPATAPAKPSDPGAAQP